MNLSEEHPEVNIREWSCFPKETDFNGMHAWRRFENKRGSAHISDKKLSNASLKCPLEHKMANFSLPSEKRPNLPMHETWANGCLWGWVRFNRIICYTFLHLKLNFNFFYLLKINLIAFHIFNNKFDYLFFLWSV